MAVEKDDVPQPVTQTHEQPLSEPVVCSLEGTHNLE